MGLSDLNLLDMRPLSRVCRSWSWADFWGCTQALFHRVIINGFDRLGKISFIGDLMFPKTVLPNR